jgi:coproporphyrinogen III oxidase-like Fe-S oxidoreductase
MNALRLREGFGLRLFTERTGLPLSVVLAPLQRARDQGLLAWHGEGTADERVMPTARGFDFLSDLTALFLTARA